MTNRALVVTTAGALAVLLACGPSKQSNKSFANESTGSTALRKAISPAVLPDSALQGTVNLAPSTPQLVAVDPYANAVSSADGLKPARPFWYSVDQGGLTIVRIDDNFVVYTLPWPATILVALPDGEFEEVSAPAAGWEPVGITVSYPTEEALASNSETPDTYVYVVMAHSGLEWQSNPTPPAGQDPGLRDLIVPATSAETESSMLLQINVTDVMFSSESFVDPSQAVSAAVLGHGAGQPAYDPATGNVYVGNMPSTSLPTTPVDLTSFVSVIAPLAPPVSEAASPFAAPEAPMVVICGPEHPEDGLLVNAPVAWGCTESGDGPAAWEFLSLPPWLHAHADKLSGKLDGLLYGTPTTTGSWTFQARVIDYGEDPAGVTSEWMSFTLLVTETAPNEAGEGGFEAGVPMAQPIEGAGDCTPAPTSSPGSLVPAWIDSVAVPNGCVVMGTAPISGEYYEFALPNFQYPYPYDRQQVIFSGNVAGPYVFDPLPPGVGLSGLAWHQIAKIHDPSTEADILNVEFIGIDPFSGQLYRILPPQGSIEVGEGSAVPETSVEGDTVEPEGAPLLDALTARSDIADALAAGSHLKVRFGDLAVQANRDIFVSAPEIIDSTGATGTPIGGPSGSAIENGALLRVSGGATSVIDLPGVQAYFLGLDSDLRPGIPGVEPGQVDHGALWVTGTTTGNIAVVDTAAATVDLKEVAGATSLGNASVNVGKNTAYVAGKALGTVTIFGSAGEPSPSAPLIWSPGLATFYVNQENSMTVLATGWPQPALACVGALPQGLTFQDNGNGTGTLSGIPVTGTGGDYPFTFVATNSLGSSSKAFVLSIGDAPLFTSPDTATFFEGALGSFTLTTTGSPSITSVWLLSGTLPDGLIFLDNGDGTGTITGVAAAGTATGGTNSDGQYVITVTASTGAPPDAVQVFTVVVKPGVPTAPEITSASSATYPLGLEPTFIFTAIGWPTPAISYSGTLPAGLEFTDNGDGSASLEGFPDAAGTYTLMITATNGVSPDATQEFNLIILPGADSAPLITLHPANQTVNSGQIATFTAAASGSPTPTVQWQQSTNGGTTFTAIPGATSLSFTTGSVNSTMNGYRYRAVFTNGSGSATTNAAILTVSGVTGTAPAVTTQPTNQIVNAGATASFTAIASGSPLPTVQWQVSPSGTSGWANIVGATSTSYTTPQATTAMNGDRYRAVFTNGVGVPAYSNAATLYVNSTPAITTQPGNQTVNAPQSATFTAAASGYPIPTVQWELSTNNGASWSPISGATSASYATGPTALAMNGYRYRAVFTNTAGSATSNVAILTVNAAPVVTTQPTNQIVNAGATATFTAAASGNPTPSIQWQRSVDNGSSWSDIGGATSTSYTTAATTTAMNGYLYRAVFTNGIGTGATSNAATLIVNPSTTSLTITTTALPDGMVGAAYSSQLQAQGGTPPYSWSLGRRESLPPGLTLTAAGLISGTPTRAGTYTFRVQVLDAASQSAAQRLVILVVRAPRR